MTKVTALVSDKGIEDIVILDAPKPVKKSKLKAVEPKSAEPSKPKIMIFGKPGVRKTWVTLDFPNTYYCDTEGGANREAYTDKLKASGGMYFGPEQGSQNFESILDEVEVLATEDHPYKTLAIDSITKPFNIEITKEAERLGDKDAFGASKKPATLLTKRLINWIDRIDMNVVLIAHEKALWNKGEQTGETFDAFDKLGHELDLILHIRKQGASWFAKVIKSRLPGFPDGESFPWSYEEFASRYGREIIERESHKLVLATDEQVARYNELVAMWKMPDGQEEKWLSKAKATSIKEMDSDKLDAVIKYIEKQLNGGK